MRKKINVYIPNRPEYFGYQKYGLEPDKYWDKFILSEWAWINQTIAILREDVEFTISERLDKKCINFCHTDDYTKIKNKHDYFVVTTICDRKVFYPSNCNVIQNKRQKLDSSYTLITHWPQPGLIKSKRKRNKNDDLNVCFMGIEKNTICLNKLSVEGVNVIEMGINRWNDYSSIDCVVAVRDFDNNPHVEKPPSKLINAWHAGVCFIGGVDSAYSDIGDDGLDYIRVTNLNDLHTALKMLREDTLYASRLINKGSTKAYDFNRAKIRDEWLNLFSSIEKDNFLTWKKSSLFEKKLLSVKGWLIYNYLRFNRKARRLKVFLIK